MRVSVVLCTYNRSKSLQTALESVAASRMPNEVEWEVLVVDNNSKDNTREVAQEFSRRDSRFRYLFETQQGLSNARNAGIRAAKGDVIAFVDDDVTVDPDWLQSLTAPLQDSRLAGAGGRIRAQEALELPKWLRLEGPFAMGGSIAALFDRGNQSRELCEPPYGTNMAYRKCMFAKYGYFRADLGRSSNNMIGKEDTEFGERLLRSDQHLWYAPSAVVFHPILPERLTKQYFLAWWFGCGQSMIRQLGPQPGKWGIPQYVLTSGMIAISALRWFRTVDPVERFFWKSWTWMYAGKAAENYRQSRSAIAEPEDRKIDTPSSSSVSEAVSSSASVATKTKRILFVTRTYEYGGAEKHLIDLLERMRQPGLEITVVCFAGDPFTERLNPDSNVVVQTSANMPNSLVGWRSFFRSAGADAVIFVHAWSCNLHWMAPIGAWLASVPRRYAIQHLVIPEGRKKTLFARIRRGITAHLNLTISSATLQRTICVSDAVKKALVEDYRYLAKTMKTIHNGVSLSQFVPAPEDGLRIREEYGIHPGEFLLVCVARLTEQKGIDTLLNAMAKIRQAGAPCKCIIVGAGPLREELSRQSQQLGLNCNVVFTGFRHDVRPYLHAASALVMTSRREGLPLVILEAMACGLPCIVTDVGGNREAVVDKVTGFVIPAGSIDAAAEAISFLASHPEERARMSEAALARARQEFDIESCMSEIKNVILN
jgi:glucosyl-dolichyl phosphate glucuronosyltransferase